MYRPLVAALALALLMAGGCAATRLQPNRRLAAGETVVTGSVNAALFVPNRVGASVVHGLGAADVSADTAFNGSLDIELGGGVRGYLGPLNAALRGGVLLDVDGADVFPAADLRLTSRSDEDFPFYAGVTANGLWTDGQAVGYLGLLAGAEVRARDLVVQAELSALPLHFGADGVRWAQGDDFGIPNIGYPIDFERDSLDPAFTIQLAVALQFDLPSPTGGPSARR